MHAVVAGAGIGGLTTALALARAGAGVTILERAAVLAEAGAGVQLSPNATRILAGLGVLERLRRFALVPEALTIRRGRDGLQLARMRLGPPAETRWGAPTLVVHRSDLQRGLLEAIAREPGISLEAGTEVAGYSAHVDSVKIGARRGEAGVTFAGDLLVGADGLHSAVRGRLCADASDAPICSGRVAWRALIPAADVKPDFQAPVVNLWLGRDAHLVHYPLRDAAVINVVAIFEDGEDEREPADASWSAAGDPAVVGRKFSDWCGAVRDFIAAAPEWRTWPLFERRVLARWSNGRVTLVGDAAHAMLPFLAQGAAQAIEDAAALARAVAAAPHDIPTALEAYGHARCARAARVQRQSRRQGWMYHLAGPLALARDLSMRGLGADRLIARYDWIYADKS